MSTKEEWLHQENQALRNEVAFLKRQLERAKWNLELEEVEK